MVGMARGNSLRADGPKTRAHASLGRDLALSGLGVADALDPCEAARTEGEGPRISAKSLLGKDLLVNGAPR